MSVPQAVGWQTGETPTVPAGMRIQAMATGLMHPRIVYPLPNGDILVVEANGPGTKPFRPELGIPDMLSRFLMGHAREGVSAEDIAELIVSNEPALRAAQEKISEHMFKLLGLPSP